MRLEVNVKKYKKTAPSLPVAINFNVFKILLGIFENSSSTNDVEWPPSPITNNCGTLGIL